MTKPQVLAAFAVLPLALCALDSQAQAQANAGPQPQPEPWHLVWSDEFDAPGAPDARHWKFERGFVRNEEEQWYQPENALCEFGLLTIEARREARPNPSFEAGSPDWKKSRAQAAYTSASLTTGGLRDWRYGRFEMRARIETRAGLWPAFWTVGREGEWPSNGEIDIMEFYRGDLLANVAWATGQRWVARWDSTRTPLKELGGSEWSSQFHIWRMDWDESAIRLFVDGRLLNETLLKDTTNGDAEGRNPFRQPHSIILNLAVGGQNGGDAGATAFPARFEIDYVRVFQKPSQIAAQARGEEEAK